MSTLDDAFANYCDHIGTTILVNNKTKLVKCNKCNKSFICDHTYGSRPFSREPWNGIAPTICSLCNTIVKRGFP